MRLLILLLIASLGYASETGAQDLLKDINATSPLGSNPRFLTIAGSNLFFAAYSNPEIGDELWKTDGISVSLVKDILPGPAGANNSSGPHRLTALEDRVFFVADDGVHGDELWVSDGSESGTYMVLDIYPGADNGDPQNLTAGGDWLFFSARDGTAGRELWKTDGTPGGTVRVKDIQPGIGNSDPNGLKMWNDTLFFVAYETATGRELWRSQGTAASTRRVRDLYPGVSNSSPASLTVFNNKLFFVAARPTSTGRGLFSTSGDSTGTTAIIFFGIPNEGPRELIVVNNTLFFWVNGTPGGPGYLGNELWKSNGTANGTLLRKDIYPGSPFASSNPASLFVWNNALYFTASDLDHGNELWKYAFAPLPVTWLDFRAERVDEAVRLWWQTASEQNNKGFEVQRLHSGARWVTLGFVEGAGNTAETRQYDYFDRQPLSGINYYRLRQVDWDGKPGYSSVVSVDIPGTAVRVYPNPGQGLFYIQAPEYQEDLQVRVFDPTGRLITVQFFRAGERRLDLQSCPAGMYVLQIKTGGELMMIKVLKE